MDTEIEEHQRNRTKAHGKRTWALVYVQRWDAKIGREFKELDYEDRLKLVLLISKGGYDR